MLGRALHVGAGGHALPAWLPFHEEYEQVSLDIDPQCQPDIVASMTDMGEIGEYELVYSSHCLEHLYPWQVVPALKECLRVLKPDGKLLLLTPDLEGVKPTNEILFVADIGPVTGHDMYYGHSESAAKSPAMAHHCGFVRETLEAAISDAGFSTVVVNRIPHYNLMGGGVKA